MTSHGPLVVVHQLSRLLDALDIPYVLGGSVASALLGEPRGTIDVDIAISVGDDQVEALLATAAVDFYVPVEFARAAIAQRSSFNLVPNDGVMKVDLFVLGGSVLDRNQLARRIPVTPPGFDAPIWVTSPEDQILRKLDWLRKGGNASDHQWRDVIGILRIRGDRLDLGYLRTTAAEVGLSADLDDAITASS